jgi:hypothetical protein
MSKNKMIKTTQQKEKSKIIFTQITGNIFKIMETKTAPKKERKLYNLCKKHWT